MKSLAATKRRAILLILAALLVLAHTALAMSSASYRLDWFTPLTSGGGGSASSTHYAADLTVGQVAIATSFSSHYGVGLGYWYGLIEWFQTHLPLVLR